MRTERSYAGVQGVVAQSFSLGQPHTRIFIYLFILYKISNDSNNGRNYFSSLSKCNYTIFSVKDILRLTIILFLIKFMGFIYEYTCSFTV